MAKDTIPHTHLRHPRSFKQVCDEYRTLWDKVWWNRHIRNGEPETGRSMARILEDRHGREFLNSDNDIEWGVCLGKMMALAWVLGSDWEGSGDT